MAMWLACGPKGTTWSRLKTSTSSSTKRCWRPPPAATLKCQHGICMPTSRNSPSPHPARRLLPWSWSSRWLTSTDEGFFFISHCTLASCRMKRFLPFRAVFSESPLSSRTAECQEKQEDNYCPNLSLLVVFKPLKTAFVWKLGEFVLISRNGGATFASFFFQADRCGSVYAECMFDLDVAWIASPGSGSRRPEP